MNWNKEARLDEHQVVKAPDVENSHWSDPGVRKGGSSLVKRSGKKWMRELEVDGMKLGVWISGSGSSVAARSSTEQGEREGKMKISG